LRLKDFGPYIGFDVTRNGKFILLGGRKGHLAMVDWKSKKLITEFQAKEKVRDVCFLQNDQMFAVDHVEPILLEYLAYHFLLVSASHSGQLKYLDVSMGKVISEAKTKRGPPGCMR
jgi:U3 small nucleolar RNA-associated protein 7